MLEENSYAPSPGVKSRLAIDRVAVQKLTATSIRVATLLIKKRLASLDERLVGPDAQRAFEKLQIEYDSGLRLA